MEIPKTWELYQDLAIHVRDWHVKTGLIGTGHDINHDLIVSELAKQVAWKEDEYAAKLAGIAGLLHSTDRLLVAEKGALHDGISTVPDISEQDVRYRARLLLVEYTDISDDIDLSRIVEAVIHHGSKPNQLGDDLVMAALADGDRLANMGPDLPMRSGQLYNRIKLFDPVTYELDLSNRSAKEKYQHPDSVFWDLQNAVNWLRVPTGPYSLRLARSLEIGRKRAEFLEDYMEKIKAEMAELGLNPYPAFLLS